MVQERQRYPAIPRATSSKLVHDTRAGHLPSPLPRCDLARSGMNWRFCSCLFLFLNRISSGVEARETLAVSLQHSMAHMPLAWQPCRQLQWHRFVHACALTIERDSTRCLQ